MYIIFEYRTVYNIQLYGASFDFGAEANCPQSLMANLISVLDACFADHL